MENLSEKLQAKIIDYTQKHQPEYYWDYRSELSDEQIAKIFNNPEEGLCEVECEIMESNYDYEWELTTSAIKEVADFFEEEICEETGTSRDDWSDEFSDWVRDYISIDTNIADLVRNTGKQVFFYDTGFEFQGWGSTPAEYRLDRMIIKNALQIKTSNYDRQIDSLLEEASYGGQLVVYFREYVNDLLDSIPNANVITFKNAHIAIINTLNGSGFDCDLPGHKFSLPFSPDCLFHEKSIKYNYTYAVCGMVSDWCDGTEFNFSITETTPEVKKSSLGAIQERDRHFAEVFKQGECSIGDIDIRRHRRVEYVNEFPCGHHCRDCGHFWID